MTIGCRDIETILVAHEMDPSRRELYVEGRRDAVFLRWVVGVRLQRDAQVVEIDEVETPAGLAGNNRAQLLYLAQRVYGSHADIRCFADADFDRLLAREQPGNVTLTDRRDIEGYLIRADCFDKLLRLGLNNSTADPVSLLGEMCRLCRRIGLVRICSEKGQWGLPFKATPVKRYVNVKGFSLSFDFERWLIALFQNADLSLSKRPEFENQLIATTEEFSATPDIEIAHGKDFMAVVEKFMACQKMEGDPPSSKMLWTSFERQMAREYGNLRQIVDYLEEVR